MQDLPYKASTFLYLLVIKDCKKYFNAIMPRGSRKKSSSLNGRALRGGGGGGREKKIFFLVGGVKEGGGGGGVKGPGH